MMEAGILMLFVMLGSGLLAIACLVAWIWALVDILKNEFLGPNKLVWLLLVIFLPLIGVICYYFIGTKQKLPTYTNTAH